MGYRVSREVRTENASFYYGRLEEWICNGLIAVRSKERGGTFGRQEDSAISTANFVADYFANHWPKRQ
ncbi:MAG: hypothetical protein WDO73_09545 [Ignavibacteriota bacterium]